MDPCGGAQVCQHITGFHSGRVHVAVDPNSNPTLTRAGMYGESSVREVALATGAVLREKALAHSDFGEGLVKVGSRCVAPPAVPCLAQQGR